MAPPVISATGLRKSYGDREAVRGVDLTVEQGEIVAVLGPNGAGKTTTVEILEGYRQRTAGEVTVLGVDPARATAAWRARIGVVLQECQLEPLLSVQESLELYAGYYRSPRPVDETIELVGLGEQRHQRAGKLSGGQRRRLDVALALVGDPDLIFLDEPTTGFDPQARRDAWEMIESLRRLGKTILLTTHYMDEAERLADRVAIMNDGVIVAEGAPGDLGADRRTAISFGVPDPATQGDLPAVIGSRASVVGDRVVLLTDSPVADLAELCGWAVARGAELAGLEVRRPTLEDVYLKLTAAATA